MADNSAGRPAGGEAWERFAVSPEDREAIRLVRSNPRRQVETLGIIVPLEQARAFLEFQHSRPLRGDWREAAVLAAATLALLILSAGALIG